MSLLLETIMVFNRQPMNLSWHNQRFISSMRSNFGINPKKDLDALITIPPSCGMGLVKCRFVYGPEYVTTEFLPYIRRPVATLKLVHSSTIEYNFKHLDRQNLTDLFDRRGSCDDVIIVKNGLVTDSYYANLVFFDGSDWVTPDTPLLKGTQRARLLSEKIIREATITADDLSSFEKVGLINAFNDLTEMPQIAIENIKR